MDATIGVSAAEAVIREQELSPMEDELSAKFVPEGEPSDIKIIVAEFASAKQAVAAFEDLTRWSAKPGKNRSGFSAWRLAAEDGQPRIVAAAVIVLSGLSDPIISRLKRQGGELRDLPETLKAELASTVSPCEGVRRTGRGHPPRAGGHRVGPRRAAAAAKRRRREPSSDCPIWSAGRCRLRRRLSREEPGSRV
jgi:hypothetical protein